MTSMRLRLEQDDPSFVIEFFKTGKKTCSININNQKRMWCDMYSVPLPEVLFIERCRVCVLAMKAKLHEQGYFVCCSQVFTSKREWYEHMAKVHKIPAIQVILEEEKV